jgi:DNA-binding MarR family transcriptional regulator
MLRLIEKRPLTDNEIRTELRSVRYGHSLATIRAYLKPLICAELIDHRHGKYALTMKGRKVLQLVHDTSFLLRFPSNSLCHEELALIAIKNRYRTFEELAKIVSRSLLGRVLSRLQKQGLIQSNRPKDRVEFYKVRVRLHGDASPTEWRLFHALSEDGASVRDLSRRVGITVRRTYKYLSRLKKRGLILQRNIPVTYELTPTGRTVADFIEEIASQALDAPRRIVLAAHLDSEDPNMKRPLTLIQQYGEKGILQADLWKRLGLDSRRGSRQVLNLEKRGLIERRRELNRGRWTFRIFPKRKNATVDSIADIPCASCEDDFRGSCPTNTVNPATCEKLTHWLIDLGRDMA